VNNVIPMTIVQGAADLSGKFPRNTFSQSSMANDEIEHLSAIDILKDHVVVMLMHNHFAHAADVRVVE
jgi:formylmethanofuran dehydrogenase subunit E-like metal-binding protein